MCYLTYSFRLLMDEDHHSLGGTTLSIRLVNLLSLWPTVAMLSG